MNTWGWISLVVIVAPLVALDRWIARDRRRTRGREHIFRQYGSNSDNSHLADTSASTEVLPRVQPAPPDTLQVGCFSGVLPLPERRRRYAQRPTPHRRQASHAPELDVMQRILNGLRNLD